MIAVAVGAVVAVVAEGDALELSVDLTVSLPHETRNIRMGSLIKRRMLGNISEMGLRALPLVHELSQER